MSRAALLPSPGDPFLLAYFLKFFKTVWYNEVDRLYILYNTPIEDVVVDAVKELCNDPKITLLYKPNYTDHGGAIDMMLDICKEDYVMLIEDDAYIFKQRAVNDGFEWIEKGETDIVAGKRGSCALEIIERAKDVWGTDGHGCNFWPNFFFIKKEKLLLTDRNFNAKAWYRGDTIPGLGLYVDTDVMYGDTFVNTSLQLRAMQLRIHLENQYHLSTDDHADAERRRNVFDGEARWCHVGSLSSGIGGFLRDDFLRPLSLRWQPVTGDEEMPNYCNSEGERLELERRVCFWKMAFEYAQTIGFDLKIESFSMDYAKALNRVVSHYGLNQNRIKNRINLYKGLGL